MLVGHVDSYTGPAVFYGVKDLRKDDEIVVTRTDGYRVRFAVYDRETVQKDAFPTSRVYGDTDRRRAAPGHVRRARSTPSPATTATTSSSTPSRYAGNGPGAAGARHRCDVLVLAGGLLAAGSASGSSHPDAPAAAPAAAAAVAGPA